MSAKPFCETRLLADCNNVVIFGGGMVGRRLCSSPEDLPIDRARSEADITSPAAIREAFDRHGVSARTVVINAAAKTDLDWCETNEHRAFEVNALGVYHLGHEAKKRGAFFVQISTGAVFDGASPPRSDGYSVIDGPCPKSVYARSKWLGEETLLSLWDTAGHEGLIVRLQHVYGRGGQNRASNARLAMLDGRDVFSVSERGASPTWVGDAVRGIYASVFSTQLVLAHVAAEHPVTWRGWYEALAEKIGFKGKLEPADETKLAAFRPEFGGLDSTVDIGTWQESLDRYLAEEHSL